MVKRIRQMTIFIQKEDIKIKKINNYYLKFLKNMKLKGKSTCVFLC